MYAVRYNNMELIEYFIEKGMRTNVNSIFNHISIVHCAVYSCDTKVLHYVLNVLKESPNPLNS